MVSCRNQNAYQRVAWSCCVPRDTHTRNWLGLSPLQQLWRLSSARFDDWLHTLVHGKWVPVHNKHRRSGKGSVLVGVKIGAFWRFGCPEKLAHQNFTLAICTICAHTSIPLAAAVCMQREHQPTTYSFDFSLPFDLLFECLEEWVCLTKPFPACDTLCVH